MIDLILPAAAVMILFWFIHRSLAFRWQSAINCLTVPPSADPGPRYGGPSTGRFKREHWIQTPSGLRGVLYSQSDLKFCVGPVPPRLPATYRFIGTIGLAELHAKPDPWEIVADDGVLFKSQKKSSSSFFQRDSDTSNEMPCSARKRSPENLESGRIYEAMPPPLKRLKVSLTKTPVDSDDERPCLPTATWLSPPPSPVSSPTVLPRQPPAQRLPSPPKDTPMPSFEEQHRSEVPHEEINLKENGNKISYNKETLIKSDEPTKVPVELLTAEPPTRSSSTERAKTTLATTPAAKSTLSERVNLLLSPGPIRVHPFRRESWFLMEMPPPVLKSPPPPQTKSMPADVKQIYSHSSPQVRRKSAPLLVRRGMREMYQTAGPESWKRPFDLDLYFRIDPPKARDPHLQQSEFPVEEEPPLSPEKNPSVEPTITMSTEDTAAVRTIPHMSPVPTSPQSDVQSEGNRSDEEEDADASTTDSLQLMSSPVSARNGSPPTTPPPFHSLSPTPSQRHSTPPRTPPASPSPQQAAVTPVPWSPGSPASAPSSPAGLQAQPPPTPVQQPAPPLPAPQPAVVLSPSRRALLETLKKEEKMATERMKQLIDPIVMQGRLLHHTVHDIVDKIKSRRTAVRTLLKKARRDDVDETRRKWEKVGDSIFS